MRLPALALVALLASTSLFPVAALAQSQSTASDERPRPAHKSDEPTAPTTTDTEKGAGSARTEDARNAKISDADIVTAPVFERKSVTHHTVVIDGKTIPYTATAGTLTLRDDQGKPIASMFYVAYTTDQHSANRPVTFFYNGGPGSASLWLHMGSFGPVRVHTDSPDPTHNAPFTFENNNESLLDKTDMVYLDAIGAGYSRPLGDTKGDKFWGVDQDIDAFTRAIKRYITINDRWNSPKYLFGESYGTTRSAGLSYSLQEAGVQLNGVMLLSSILNYSIRSPGYDRLYVGYVPTYAAAAWYHNKLANKPADLPAFLEEVRAWAAGPYLEALTKGSDLSPQEEDQIAQQLSAYTGLSVRFLKENKLRVDLQRFRKELLRDEHRTIGRYDSRFEGIDADDGGEGPETDPSDTGITGAFIGALHTYLVDDLNYRTDMDYLPSGPDVNRNWDWHHKVPGGRFPETQPDVAIDLSQAMRQNPHMRVYSLNGWYDMATPFYETEYDLKHMLLDPTIRPNLRFAYYPSGHMVYLNPDALKTLKADVGRFYDEGR
jgi:carboxypeptidase C (cathepsin A)